ncbi:MAG: cellulase family glycosylhydrolase [Anaerolineae bacterium]|nr:cellulase family glycosylhydrolase [Anaerolineae bacterium]
MKILRFLLVLVVILVLVGTGGYFGRDALSRFAFNLTGEEELSSQILGVGQLGLNLTHPPLQTRPHAAIQYTGSNPFGINTFLQHEVEPAKREESARLISEAGFQWIRQEFPWQDIEIAGRGDFIDRRNNPDGIDAWAKYDHIVDLAEQYDLKIVARISSTPAWTRARPEEETGSFAPPDDFDDYARFAATLAERYRGRIHYYQLWNEPNIYPEWGEQAVDPEAYTDLLCRAYKAVKEADPDAVILSGALAATIELSERDLNDYIFLQRMYDAGAGNCFDILSMQGYGLWSGPTDQRMRPMVVNYAHNVFIRDIMVRNGDERKPIWISEMNWNAAPEGVEPRYGRVTLEQQARWAPMAYQRAQEEWPWVGVINLWYFKRADDSWLRAQQPEAYFQMADPDFNLMPIYDSMKTYTHQPPVMYLGNHAADHWAVTYGRGWEPANGGMQTVKGGAETVELTFKGTSLEIIFGPSGVPNSDITYRVDGGQFIRVGRHEERVTWRGWYGHHTVELRPANGVMITRYIVRYDMPLLLVVLLGVAVVLCLVLLVFRRRLRPVDSIED